MTLDRTYRLLERLIVLFTILGLLAMFRPWFKELVGLFEPLAPDARLARTYEREVAPIILRYGFYSVFLSTVAYIVLTHYSVDDLRRAAREKGIGLTALLIAMPVLYGFVVIFHLSQDYRQAALLGVFHFVFAVAIWNWKRWGLIGLGLSTIVELLLALSGSASLPLGILFVLVFGLMFALIWPRRTHFRSEPQPDRL